ncbi:MAG: DUF4198 domain-containing protein, partial [Desulfovermiculus sp.]
MKKLFTLTAALGVMFWMSLPAQAHFQTLYTPESALNKGEELNFKLVFTHPFDAGHTMDMEKPLEFFAVHKGEKTDLTDDLQPITWQSLDNSGRAYEASHALRGMGDWVFALTPAPYFEEKEDAYIQQLTKAIVNVQGLPTDWDSELGMKAEIVPLDKPYALWTGNVFRGVVKSEGKPVPHAEIEVEYLNHEPLMDKNAFAEEPQAEAPQSAFVTQTIKANEHGEFTYGVPEEGWWGFCALGVGPDKEYKDKELSQDAVIW